ncbi:auxin-responsive protein SAUR36-like [Mercurialis annua]|uniref:auxin-responsive protein SAUR36-like n=1 Tax=Mercurialis annua TaxID=3986 RepID=UPI00215EFBB8|nr:auxin-responsive protein SAUR36-like [Mercurialis annua]
MKKFRGFKLGRRIARVFKWIIRPHKKPTRLCSLNCQSTVSFNPISKLLNLARKLGSPNRDYIRLGQAKNQAAEVPKGHLAIYVGDKNGDSRREVVPVIYFNHPLFGKLLKDSERVYGHDHPGGIKIPCGYSEFEKVKMRIATWYDCTTTTSPRWKQQYKHL